MTRARGVVIHSNAPGTARTKGEHMKVKFKVYRRRSLPGVEDRHVRGIDLEPVAHPLLLTREQIDALMSADGPESE